MAIVKTTEARLGLPSTTGGAAAAVLYQVGGTSVRLKQGDDNVQLDRGQLLELVNAWPELAQDLNEPPPGLPTKQPLPNTRY